MRMIVPKANAMKMRMGKNLASMLSIGFESF
jgi:hypothetical protein